MSLLIDKTDPLEREYGAESPLATPIDEDEILEAIGLLGVSMNQATQRIEKSSDGRAVIAAMLASHKALIDRIENLLKRKKGAWEFKVMRDAYGEMDKIIAREI